MMRKNFVRTTLRRVAPAALKTKHRVLILLMVCLLALPAPTFGHAEAGNVALAGRRFECLYQIVDGKSVFISDPSERPFIEFVDDAKCTFPDSEDGSYLLSGDKLAVLEAGILPMYTFYVVDAGTLRVAGMGLDFASTDGYDPHYHATDSKTYGELCGVAEEQTSAGKSIADYNVCWLGRFINGYAGFAARIDRNGNFRYGYMDTAGNVVLEPVYGGCGLGRYFGNELPMPPGKSSFMVYNKETDSRELVDVQGNVIMNLSFAGAVGRISEGKFFAVTKDEQISGDVYATTYYDETGASLFAFEHVSSAGSASNFSEGAAVLFRVDEGGKLLQPFMIDANGKVSEIRIANMDVLDDLAAENGYTNLKNGRLTYETIGGFRDGDPYALAHLGYMFDDIRDEYKISDVYLNAVALLDRDGNGTVLPFRLTYNDKCDYSEGIVTCGSRVYNVDTGVMTDLLDLPVFEGARGVTAYACRDGYIIADAYAREQMFFAVLDRNMNVVVQPEVSHWAPYGDIRSYADGIITMRYYEGQKPEVDQLDNSMEDGICLFRDPSTAEGYHFAGQLYYRNVSGERLIDQQFDFATDFQDGYAIAGMRPGDDDNVFEDTVLYDCFYIDRQGNRFIVFDDSGLSASAPAENRLTVDAGYLQGLSASAAGGRGMTINVSSDTDWFVSVAEGSDWISLSASGGSGNGSFFTEIAANSGEERVGWIEVSAPGCDAIRIKVTQGAPIAAEASAAPADIQRPGKPSASLADASASVLQGQEVHFVIQTEPNAWVSLYVNGKKIKNDGIQADASGQALYNRAFSTVDDDLQVQFSATLGDLESALSDPIVLTVKAKPGAALTINRTTADGTIKTTSIGGAFAGEDGYIYANLIEVVQAMGGKCTKGKGYIDIELPAPDFVSISARIPTDALSPTSGSTVALYGYNGKEVGYVWVNRREAGGPVMVTADQLLALAGYVTDSAFAYSNRDHAMTVTEDGRYTVRFRNSIDDKDLKPESFDCYFGYSLFDEPATTYDERLALTSALAMSAAYPPNDAVIGDTVFGPQYKIAVNAKYVLEMLKNFGFKDIETHHYDDLTNVESGGHSVGYVLAHRSLCFPDRSACEVIAVIARGTTCNEWYSNFDVGAGSLYHLGFKKAADELMGSLDSYVSAHGLGGRPDETKLWITGHSRGAAVANIVAGELSGTERYATADNLYAYTFATPNIVNSNAALASASAWNACLTRRLDADSSKGYAVEYANIFNFVNRDDFVTYVSPWVNDQNGNFVLDVYENPRHADDLKRADYSNIDSMLFQAKYGISISFVPCVDSALSAKSKDTFHALCGKTYDDYTVYQMLAIVDAFIGFTGNTQLMYDTSTISESVDRFADFYRRYDIPYEVFHDLAGAIVKNGWETGATVGNALSSHPVLFSGNATREGAGNIEDAAEILYFFIHAGTITKEIFHAHAPDIYIATVAAYNDRLGDTAGAVTLRDQKKGNVEIKDIQVDGGHRYGSLASIARLIDCKVTKDTASVYEMEVSNAATGMEYVFAIDKAELAARGAMEVTYKTSGFFGETAGFFLVKENGGRYLVELDQFGGCAGYCRTYPDSNEYATTER